MTGKPGARLPAARRRDLILQAATETFGQHGYDGATTDQVARAAGVSQPYVVRMFGTKEHLFLEVVDRAIETLLTAFRTAIGEHAETGGSAAELPAILGALYVDLAEARALHRSLLHAFVQGSDPVVGDRARTGFLQIWAMLRDEAGLDEAEARDFLARGMLISVLLSIQMPSRATVDARAREMLASTFGAHLPMVLRTQ